jgi:hypothetical protein
VQPGDLITSELINAIIDALGGLDAKITKCCEEHKEPEPKPEEPKEKVFIEEVLPANAIFEEMVNIIGGGFIPDAAGNEVTIGGAPVRKFGKVTKSLIQATVPVLKIKKQTQVAVLVENANGEAKHPLNVAPEKTPDVVFVPSPPEVVNEMLKLAKVGKTDVVFDLGSGDGRIVIAAAAKFNARKAVGVELDAALIKRATVAATEAGVTDRVSFLKEDLFTVDLSEATVITIHLLPDLNLKLRPTFEKLKPGTKIVSHSFDMGDWEPVERSNQNGHDVYLWIVGK